MTLGLISLSFTFPSCKIEIRTQVYQLEENWPLDHRHAHALPIFTCPNLPYVQSWQGGQPGRFLYYLSQNILRLHHVLSINQTRLAKLFYRRVKPHSLQGTARHIHSQTAVHMAATCTQSHFTLLSAPDHIKPELCLPKKPMRGDFATSTVLALEWEELYSLLHQTEHRAKGFHHRLFLYWQV